MRKKRGLQITRICRSLTEDLREASLSWNQPCLGGLNWAAGQWLWGAHLVPCSSFSPTTA